MHVTFDRFEFDVERRALLENGAPVHLSPKAFRLLEVLVASSPRALSKEQLTDAVWPQTFVEESNLASLVAELRTALGDRPRDAQFVRTVHGFGYAFVAEVRPAESLPRVAVLLYEREEIPLYAGPNILGRDPAAGILIDDATVSRRHACITIEGEKVTLEDLASKNGTYVEEARLTGSTVIEDGTTFLLGDARLIFRRGQSAGSTITISRTR